MIIYGNYSVPGIDVSLKDEVVIEKTTRTFYSKNMEGERVKETIREDEKPHSVPGLLRALHITPNDIPENFCIIQEGWNDTVNNTDGRYWEMFLKNHKISIYDERTAIEYFKILCTQFPDDETVLSEKYSMLAI